MIGSSIYNQLSTSSAVTNLVGTRIYPNNIKEREAFPQLVYEIKNNVRDDSLNGETGLASIEVTIIAVSLSYATTDSIADAVASALHNQTGVWSGVTVQGCFLTDIVDDTVVETESDRILYYLKESTYLVWYQT